MSRNEFEKFRQLVLADESLQEALRALTDRQEFIARVIDLGAAHGHDFSSDHVEDEIRESRRRWIEGTI